MANNQGNGAGGILVAFIAGAFAGAAVALLCAPATREEAREFVNRKRDHLNTAFERARAQYQQKTGGAEEQDA